MTTQISPAHAAPRPRVYRSAACVDCRFHAPAGRCTYPAPCPYPACEWCQLRPATLAVPLNGARLELCDHCAGYPVRTERS